MFPVVIFSSGLSPIARKSSIPKRTFIALNTITVKYHLQPSNNIEYHQIIPPSHSTIWKRKLFEINFATQSVLLQDISSLHLLSTLLNCYERVSGSFNQREANQWKRLATLFNFFASFDSGSSNQCQTLCQSFFGSFFNFQHMISHKRYTEAIYQAHIPATLFKVIILRDKVNFSSMSSTLKFWFGFISWPSSLSRPISLQCDPLFR